MKKGCFKKSRRAYQSYCEAIVVVLGCVVVGNEVVEEGCCGKRKRRVQSRGGSLK